MLTLYYSPNACSMASHVALEEAGATFEATPVDIFRGEHLIPEYKVINPCARVPALAFGDGTVLLETTAILYWIGEAFGGAGLLGACPRERARTLAICAWLSGTVHPTFRLFVRAEQVSADVGAHEDIRAEARATYWRHLQDMDARLADRSWMQGERFTVADPYALVFLPWRLELGLPIRELTNLLALRDRLIGRPAALRALERERSALLSL